MYIRLLELLKNLSGQVVHLYLIKYFLAFQFHIRDEEIDFGLRRGKIKLRFVIIGSSTRSRLSQRATQTFAEIEQRQEQSKTGIGL